MKPLGSESARDSPDPAGCFAAGQLFRAASPRTVGRCRGMLGEEVAITGEGPLEQDLLCRVLADWDIEQLPVMEGCPRVIVVGHEGWEPSDLEAAIRCREGSRVRIYSQEMLLASIASGLDVYTGCSSEELRLFSVDHSALEYAEDALNFDWPSQWVGAVDAGPGAVPSGNASYVGGATLDHLGRECSGALRDLFGEAIAVMGDGPFDGDELAQMIMRCGVSVSVKSPGRATGRDVIILGHGGWREDDLQTAIEKHRGRTLRVYSQEMVLASLIAGDDVFRALERDALMEFTQGHAGLEYLVEDVGFKWPTTEVDYGDGVVLDLIDGRWVEDGILSALGYHVGVTRGLIDRERRTRLDAVFTKKLYAGSAAAEPYIAQWGEPRSSQRLKKMAHTLASLARNARRRRNVSSMQTAIREWEMDLAYLRKTYSRQVARFDWPSAQVAEQ